jgi:exodeoxyribonuclease VII large subunit
MNEKIYSVTAITRLIKYTLEESFPSIWVEGEISNYHLHSSGHRYLSLKDQNATIKLTIWRSVGQYLKFEPENGMKVRAFGDISVYEKGGNYQLNVKRLVPVGVGELEIAFRQLHEKLYAEGLFDPSRKKPIPKYPLKVGLVTSPTGAAIKDIIQIARRRNDSVQLLIYPAQVQGSGAESTIARGINYFNSRDDIDVIITGRGGGSIEDLWAFNEETLVRTIADSKIPVVTGIGHEIDTTLSDLASDLRAPTPSAAAELVIWSKESLRNQLQLYLSNFENSLQYLLDDGKYQLHQYMRRPVFKTPESLIRERQQTLDNNYRMLVNAGKNSFAKFKNGLSLAVSRLESLSPLGTMRRGYAMVRNEPAGVIVRSAFDLTKGDNIRIEFCDGTTPAKITGQSKKRN